MTSLTDIDNKQTKQAVKNAREKYFNAASDIGEEDPNGKSRQHMVWMLDKIIKDGFNKTKANRWLGYVQGWLVFHDLASLEDIKNDIRKVKEAQA